jgi:hypothetical protein
VKTDRLIDMLSTNIEPVDSRRASRRLAAAIVIGIAIAACLMTLALGLRSEVTKAGALSSFCLKLFFTGVVVVVASVALDKVMRPGGERKVPLILILLPFTCITLLAVIALAQAPSSHWQAMLLGNQWLECLSSGSSSDRGCCAGDWRSLPAAERHNRTSRLRDAVTGRSPFPELIDRAGSIRLTTG